VSAHRSLVAAERQLEGRARLTLVDFAALDGFRDDRCLDALIAFQASARQALSGSPCLRPGVEPDPSLRQACRAALDVPSDERSARQFFETQFVPVRIVPVSAEQTSGSGFLTGYYEPEVEGSRQRTADWVEPILDRPDDLVTFPQNEFPLGSGFAAGRRTFDRHLEPYPDRASIESGRIEDRTRPVVWLRDGIEAFMIHVQGSARVRLVDGGALRLTYAGRNGLPYTSIGRLLVEAGEIEAEAMTLARLKQWVRDAGQAPGQAGRSLMQRNRSYIFFTANEALDPAAGPIGAQSVSLSPLRSIAVDRGLWPYGTPFWISADLPWTSRTVTLFRRLMIAQDTGSAILGPARADLFFGTGDACGTLAGGIRHEADMFVLLPKDAS
jgi:membrane-bound lytic murein transglycosylase A